MNEGIARVLSLRLVKNQTKNGKIPRFVALVAYGNQNGGLGIGKSRHTQALEAINKATAIARKAMSYYELFEKRTIFHDDEVKFKASILQVRPAPRGIRFHYIFARYWETSASCCRRDGDVPWNRRYWR